MSTIFSRGLRVVLPLAAILLGGCVRSPEPKFYTLTPVQDQFIGRRSNPAQNAVIGIGPVKLADYLDKSQIVTRTSDEQLVKSEFNRWAGSFKDNFINVLADDLGFLLSDQQIYLYPFRPHIPIDYQITVDVIRCDGRLGDAAYLEARWSILQGQEKKLFKMNRSSIREPVTGPNYGDLVAAQSRALAKLSREIVAAIQQGGRAESRPAAPSMVHNLIAINSRNGMTTPNPIVFLVDMDDTLVENERIQDDLKRHLGNSVPNAGTASGRSRKNSLTSYS